jgi:hypothetical protein
VLPGEQTPGGSQILPDSKAREAEIRRVVEEMRARRESEAAIRQREQALRAEQAARQPTRSPLDGLRFGLRSVWGRFDGGHPADKPVPNRHEVTIDWFRVELRAAYTIDANWEVETLLPFDIKRQRAKYKLPDGTSFDNPIGDLHHRSETLYGLGDAQQWARWTAYGVFHNSISFTAGFGLTIPIGRTEPDPYRLGDAGKRHQHIQFGTGTVDPLASVALNVDHGWWGLGASVGGTFPAYRNRHGYRGAPSGEAALNFRVRVTGWFSAYAGLFGLAQGRAYWNSKVDPNTGYTSTGARLGLNFALGDHVWISPSGTYIFDTVTPYGSETFRSQFMASLTITFFFGARTMGPSILNG